MIHNEHPEKSKNTIEIKLSDELESRLLGTYCDAFIRLMWLSFLHPDMSGPQLQRHWAREGERVSIILDLALDSLKDELKKVLQAAVHVSGTPANQRQEKLELLFQALERRDGKERLPKFQKLRNVLSIPAEPDEEIRSGLRLLSELGRKDDTAFVGFLGSLGDRFKEGDKGGRPGDNAEQVLLDAFAPYMAAAAADWLRRVKPLTPELISTVRQVRVELIEWLARHPTAISSVAWDAFEKIIAELLASKGFEVELTARTPNASADIIAIRRDKLGVKTRYLVECKRFHDKRRVGLSIVNGVLGAKKRAGVDHALLVTTSDFTRPVRTLEESLRDHRLHLRDGDNVRDWLASYEPTKHGGLWLDTGWNLDTEPD